MAARKCQLNDQQINILRALRVGPLTGAQIEARYAGTEAGSITSGLRRRGWVRCTGSPKHGFAYQLTPAGWQAVAQLPPRNKHLRRMQERNQPKENAKCTTC